ncbi:MAG TPA: hypothetical protein VN966_00110, partial [Candidatus Bathyarchaeia archaeon]|nr:hypothetical protein [Candidatus Bathyarchaeia archaeon]
MQVIGKYNVKIAEYFANRSAKLAKWQSTLAAWPCIWRAGLKKSAVISPAVKPGQAPSEGQPVAPEAAAAATSQSDANRFMRARNVTTSRNPSAHRAIQLRPAT